MPSRVKLSDIVNAIESHMEEVSSFLNKKTGKVVSFADDELRDVEEQDLEGLLAHCQEWQKETYVRASELIAHEDDFLPLPDRWGIDEYSIMEAFCFFVTDERISRSLQNAIRGKGAFRRFKEGIRRFGVQDDWYRCHRNRYEELAKEWCRENGVEFTEENPQGPSSPQGAAE